VDDDDYIPFEGRLWKNGKIPPICQKTLDQVEELLIVQADKNRCGPPRPLLYPEDYT